MAADASVVANALTREQVAAGLSHLSRTADGTTLALVNLELSDLGLASVDALSEFPHVQNVNLSLNALTSLAPLGALPFLLTLDASSNALTAALDFTPPRALLRANLAWNAIEQVRGLERFDTLQVLILDSNQLDTLDGLGALSRLLILSVRANRLTRLDGLAGLPLKELYVSSNGLTSLAGVETLTQLEVLDASDNRVDTVSALTCAHALLDELFLEGNALGHVDALGSLAAVRLLRHVSFRGNDAMTSAGDYRARVVFMLPQLTMLDEVPISTDERVSALNTYAPPPEVRAYRQHCIEYDELLAREFAIPQPRA